MIINHPLALIQLKYKEQLNKILSSFIYPRLSIPIWFDFFLGNIENILNNILVTEQLWLPLFSI